MREFRMILPVADNSGQSLEAEHRALQTLLCKHFGGYTATQALGGWCPSPGVHQSEHVTVYDVACEWKNYAFEADTLRSLARNIAALAKQKTVYLRLPDGTVEFIAPMIVTSAA